eukprot:TRINITY_DN8044_c0_g2_i7.p1 TRINITY_DN8044_c0_g2~~TRINITY_DN8044_c0_g2_i7.p1  ORF type:complete len:128 (+),score=20.97 TRINITY_DN8044_c0_g2_i7:95-478(+)
MLSQSRRCSNQARPPAQRCCHCPAGSAAPEPRHVPQQRRRPKVAKHAAHILVRSRGSGAAFESGGHMVGRGPVSKNDVIAIRNKVGLLIKMVTQILKHFGINTEELDGNNGEKVLDAFQRLDSNRKT